MLLCTTTKHPTMPQHMSSSLPSNNRTKFQAPMMQRQPHCPARKQSDSVPENSDKFTLDIGFRSISYITFLESFFQCRGIAVFRPLSTRSVNSPSVGASSALCTRFTSLVGFHTLYGTTAGKPDKLDWWLILSRRVSYALNEQRIRGRLLSQTWNAS